MITPDMHKHITRRINTDTITIVNIIHVDAPPPPSFALTGGGFTDTMGIVVFVTGFTGFVVEVLLNTLQVNVWVLRITV